LSELFYIVNSLPLQWAQLTNTVHTARLGLEFSFLCNLDYVICLDFLFNLAS